jgi:DNA-binding NarL/FixJ family response regulator
MIPETSFAEASNETSGSAPSASGSSGACRILIVDDHPVFRRGLAGLLVEELGYSVCGEADTSRQALDAMRRLQPDVALVDISMPGANGIELIKLMSAEQPKLIIVMLSLHQESVYALRALRAGAKGYVMKAHAMEVLPEALKKVLNGGIYISPSFTERLISRAAQALESGRGSAVDQLSPRELEVFRLIGQGFGTREASERLGLSIKTIETHRAHIKEKLGIKDSNEVIRFAIEWMGQQLSPATSPV